MKLGFKPKRITIVGCGGIGTRLIPEIAMFMSYYPKLASCPLDLVDGDTFTPTNSSRQWFEGFGNKATITAETVRGEFPNLHVKAISDFLSPASAIESAQSSAIAVEDVIGDRCVVFLAVDNHKTRLFVSQHIQTLPNVLLISGGNDLVDGVVLCCHRVGGISRLLPIEESHPDILTSQDKAPYEMDCDTLARSPGTQQLGITNMFAATLMCAAFLAALDGKLTASEIRFDTHAFQDGIVGPAVSIA